MNISVTDYIGKISNGVGVILSWKIGDDLYEIIFWFSKDNRYRVYMDDDLKKRLGINDVTEWDQLHNLIIYANSILPPKEKIFSEFNV